ncbi:MAG: alpha-2-macroglobulin [Pirellulales bacterium]|nr:alpha-2-macroglobulin [Pirellulales bacterium]
MKKILSQFALILCGFVILLIGMDLVHSTDASGPPSRTALRKMMQDGNFKEAYDGMRKLTLSPDADPRLVGEDMHLAIQCLQQLNRVNEIDAYREAVIESHGKNWRLLAAAAQSYMQEDHNGFLIAGEFQRGQHRGGGKFVNAEARDRVRALQLLVQAKDLVADEPARNEVSQMYMQLAQVLLYNRGWYEAWRLQYLTEINQLPDYEEGRGYRGWGGEAKGAPVDSEGKPIYHDVPRTWDEAKTDGQRWRWALTQAVEASPNCLNEVRFQFAEFLQNQFGVNTMAQYGWFRDWAGGMEHEEDRDKNESGTYALHTLTDNETIARLATGIQRFELPDEFNFIKIYQAIVDDDRTGWGNNAQDQLAAIYENRRQYPKAADAWKKGIAKYGKEPNRQSRLEQIESNWGRFEPVMTQPAGQGATVEFRFRNGNRVEFTAHAIDVPQILADVKQYIKSSPKQFDWNKVQIDNLGYRLVEENQKKYIGSEVARWSLDLTPRPDHFDERITVTTPLQKAGAYFVTAKMAGGNTSHIVLWLADTAIVKKPMPQKAFYYVADAVTGKPIAKANVEFFGWWYEHKDRNRYFMHTQNFAEFTDADGVVYVPADEKSRHYQWIATATTKEKRFAFLGFSGIWSANYHDHEYNATKVFTITDRPVYRPDQTVHFKFWVRHAQYDQEDLSQFAGQSFTVEIRNPKNEKIYTKAHTADAYGGIEGDYELPADATLGVYQLLIVNKGGSSFRVEEYKKPEFEVQIDAPAEPVMLGEKIAATVKAKYYFGAPVTEAKVKYKVLRTDYSGDWYPPSPWDWFFGPGYWWFAYDYDWYPGWRNWGCIRPLPWWIWRHPTPPEVVAEAETEIGEDGTLKIEIDTAITKEIHPDKDHRYQIEAEVVDQSRRTIVGNGRVLVARQPFKVFAWIDRGYYRSGDTVHAHFTARTLDGKPVEGAGKLQLLKIGYPDAKPVETAVQEWDLPTNSEGRADVQIKASTKGQFRLSYQVTDTAGHTMEGGYVFTIIGGGFDGSEYRFNDIEIIPDRREYGPGETAQLQINTNRTGSAVLLFVRPANGAYLPPKVLHLDGKSTVVQLGISKKDMPNFFVEAVTVARGKVHTESRELFVPPEKRILDVEVLPSATEYKPGEHAKVELRLKDHQGNAFVGSTVLAIYDKSLEYISGGSNVPEIREFFWKWRRQHQPQQETNLERYFWNLVPRGSVGMNDLGIFGATVVEEVESNKYWADSGVGGMGGAGFGGGLARGRSTYSVGKMARAPAGRALGQAMDAAAPMMEAAAADSLVVAGTREDMDEGGEGIDGAELVQPAIRQKFADTALWVASLATNNDGVAEVELDMPENLTAWKIRVWGMGHGTKVGQGDAEVVTRKNLILRLQAPRFFVEKDEIVLSANVHNYLKETKRVTARLELEGENLKPMADNAEQVVDVPANGEVRVDWRVQVVREGEASVRMLALTDEESDAMQQSFPVYVHGMLKMDSYSGVLRPEDTSGKFVVRVPAERRAEQTRLEIRYSPTLAAAMVDALPYLADYPYGCTEQTVNRFLPAVITQRTLQKMGLDLKAIGEKQTNLNAQEIGDDVERAKRWQRYDRNPVFDEAELNQIVKAGVQRLTEMQLADGGWGWFSGWGEHSTPHTTAVVVHGLQIAVQNDLAIVPGVLENGVAWLERYQHEQIQKLQNVDAAGKVINQKKPFKYHADNLDALVFMVLADAGKKNNTMLDFLYRDRTKLAVYSLANFGLALHRLGEAEKLAMVMRNISQYVTEDDENQTAWLNLPDGSWWYWYGSEYEAHAYYLKLLAATDPKSEIASRMVKYLLNNRKHATYWNSTRDTALVVEAFADYIRATGEDQPDLTVEIWVDSDKRKEVHITGKELFTFDNRLVIEGEALSAGEHTIELKKQGRGPLYYNGYMTNFTLEDFITQAGLELKVHRQYYRLVPADKTVKAAGSRGQAIDQKVEKYDRVGIENDAQLKSGDLVEIELVIESKNDYEYIIFEDMKAAGFEPVELQSGYTGNEMGAYVELRDNRVAMFVRQLARGKHSISYRMRAEIPGRFSALPTKAYAMYAPELKGNSDEIKIRVED